MPVLISGAVMAALCQLEGHLVLHASAVEVDGPGLAFAGASEQANPRWRHLRVSEEHGSSPMTCFESTTGDEIDYLLPRCNGSAPA